MQKADYTTTSEDPHGSQPPILTASAITRGIGIPSWVQPIYTRFVADLSAEEPPFPCVFGIAGMKQDSLRYAIVEANERATPWALREALLAFLPVARSIGRYTSLAVFFEPDPNPLSEAAYQQRFWETLNWLHTHDPQPWPPEIPTNPDDHRWTFSFANEPIFVVCMTPAHKARRSRQSPTFTLLFQPRFVFEGLEAHTDRGRVARQQIRARLTAYDSAPLPVELGAYGDSENREWRQFYLADSSGSPRPTQCPFIHKKAP